MAYVQKLEDARIPVFTLNNDISNTAWASAIFHLVLTEDRMGRRRRNKEKDVEEAESNINQILLESGKREELRSEN